MTATIWTLISLSPSWFRHRLDSCSALFCSARSLISHHFYTRGVNQSRDKAEVSLLRLKSVRNKQDPFLCFYFIIKTHGLLKVLSNIHSPCSFITSLPALRSLRLLIHRYFTERTETKSKNDQEHKPLCVCETVRRLASSQRLVFTNKLNNSLTTSCSEFIHFIYVFNN